MSLQPVELMSVKQEWDVTSSCESEEAGRMRDDATRGSERVPCDLLLTQNLVHVKEEVEDKNINTCQSTLSCLKSLASHAEHNSNIGEETQSNIRGTSETETYECEICEKWFSIESELSEHVHDIHQNREQVESRPDSTDEGDEETATAGTSPGQRRGHSQAHERTLTDERYSCGICNESFRFIGNLKVHERIHTGEKPFTCEVCKQKFTQIGNLKAHKRIHTGEKPYICGICKQGFTGSTNLKKHEQIHSGEKPYSCGVCLQKFTLSTYLKRHERVHREKLYSCGVCKQEFTSKGQLRTHKRLNMDCWNV